jgi:hypothetical protein
MEIKYYPDFESIQEVIKNNDPIALVIAYDESEAIAAPLDEVAEHIILLRKIGVKDSRIDEYFRVVVNGEGADWTFVCPSNYKGIKDRSRRIQTFYNDGIEIIYKALKLLHVDVKIEIPQRYRRHFNELSDGK